MNSEFIDVTAVRVVDGYQLELIWADGALTTIDAEPYLSTPAFELLRDPATFATVTVEPETGTVVWPNGADISLEELRSKSRTAVRANTQRSSRKREMTPDELRQHITDLEVLMRAAGLVPGLLPRPRTTNPSSDRTASGGRLGGRSEDAAEGRRAVSLIRGCSARRAMIRAYSGGCGI